MDSVKIKVKKLDERAVLPKYAHDGDVGMDLTAISVEYNSTNDCYEYHTGLSLESDYNYGTYLFPRRSNRRTDCYLANHVGIADSAIYRGEIILCFKNRDSLVSRAWMMASKTFMECLNNFGSTKNELAYQYAIQAYEGVMKNPMQYAPYVVGERVAQMVVLPYPNVEIEEVEELSETERGDGGFGSSGN